MGMETMMETQILYLDPIDPDRKSIEKGAEVLQKGGLVVFPTETVYGLGANGLLKESIKKIYEAKGRPSDNPLILHIADLKMAKKIGKEIPDMFYALAKRFWPGPLTMIVKKGDEVPWEVTAGLDTVAIRMPKNKIAQDLIACADTPVAAPSANLSGKPSPTKGEHVIEDLKGRVDMIIDGGSTEVGLESTVIDLTVTPPQILRPGGITLSEIREVIPDAVYDRIKDTQKPRSPGMKYRHYAPEAELILLPKEAGGKALLDRGQALEKTGKTVGYMVFQEDMALFSEKPFVYDIGRRQQKKEMAARIFDALRVLDQKKVDIILCEEVEEKEVGVAIMNRLRKAASKGIMPLPGERKEI